MLRRFWQWLSRLWRKPEPDIKPERPGLTAAEWSAEFFAEYARDSLKDERK